MGVLSKLAVVTASTTSGVGAFNTNNNRQAWFLSKSSPSRKSSLPKTSMKEDPIPHQQENWSPIPIGCSYGAFAPGCDPDATFCYRNYAAAAAAPGGIPSTAGGESPPPSPQGAGASGIDIGMDFNNFYTQKCEDKKQPGVECGFFDERYWPHVCADSEDVVTGELQRHSCQRAGELPEGGEYTGKASAAGGGDMSGDKPAKVYV